MLDFISQDSLQFFVLSLAGFGQTLVLLEVFVKVLNLQHHVSECETILESEISKNKYYKKKRLEDCKK